MVEVYSSRFIVVDLLSHTQSYRVQSAVKFFDFLRKI